jgi:hypothetical protein
MIELLQEGRKVNRHHDSCRMIIAEQHVSHSVMQECKLMRAFPHLEMENQWIIECVLSTLFQSGTPED